MSGIEDIFDRVADSYASFRPQYPETLFDQVAACCTHRDLAWEIGCGSGQATIGLASRFKRVEAMDPAPSAIEKAPCFPSVRFSVGRAESSSLAAGTVDLIASAQAAHWFDMTAFAREARRVGNQKAIVALWCYDRCRIDPGLMRLQTICTSTYSRAAGIKDARTSMPPTQLFRFPSRKSRPNHPILSWNGHWITCSGI